jgi:hypothetical protein
MNDTAQPDIMEHVSSTDFASTIQRIAEALTEAGMMLFARIDHAAGARDVGMEMPPATVLIYGRDWCKTGGQAATAVGGNESLAGWNFCPNSAPSVPL